MESIFETVKRRFDANDLGYEQTDDEPVLRTGCRGKNGNYFAYAYADDDRRLLVFQSMCPLNAPESKRTAMAELLARINWIITFGNFELDMEDGEIRFRTSVILGQNSVDEEIVDHIFLANFSAIDTFFPVITSVLFSNLAPENALEAFKSQNKGRKAKHNQGCPNNPPSSSRFGGRLGDLMGPSNN